MRRVLYVILAVVTGVCGPASAQTYNIPFADLQAIIDSSGETPDAAIRAYLASLIKAELDGLGFDAEGGLSIDAVPLDPIDYTFQTNCNLPQPFALQTEATDAQITFTSDSGLTLQLDTIRSLSLHADLGGSAYTYVPAAVLWGQDIIFIGDCVKFETDHGWVALTQPFDIDLDLAVMLEPSYDPEQLAIVVDKHATLGGQAIVSGGDLQHDFGTFSLTDLLISIFEDRLLDELSNRAEETVAENIVALNYRLDGRDENGQLDPNIVAFNGPSVFVLDVEEDDEALVNDILVQLGVPDILLDILDDRGIDILLQLALLEGEAREIFLAELGATASCDVLLDNFEITMPATPVYEFDGQDCNVAALDGPDSSSYYSDAQCTSQLAYRPTDDVEFCQSRFGPTAGETVGNAASWIADINQPNDVLPSVPSRNWTTNPSTQLDLGVISMVGNKRPFIKQLNYRSIANIPRGSGVCELEMRVYKNDITATGLKPLIALHGGTWRNRGFSFFGLEAGISQLTERGFVVFAPFYRLTDTADGNIECNGATWREVVADTEAALDWVRTNGTAFGAIDEPVTLFGQSAGAHLAGWLAANRSDDVRRAAMFYAPTDVLEFLNAAVTPGGPYEDNRNFALRSLAKFFGARNGSDEIHLELINYTGLTPQLLESDPLGLIPNAVFDLSLVDPFAPPLYLARCATITELDLTTVNLLAPPTELLNCLKQDLGEFLVSNSFNHLFVDEPVPVHLLHGSADSIVPYSQALNLCAAIDGNSQPGTITAPLTAYACGNASEVQIVKDSEHALELGTCFDSLCPAGPPGSEQRAATATAINVAFDWLLIEPQGTFEPIACGKTSNSQYAPAGKCPTKTPIGPPSRRHVVVPETPGDEPRLVDESDWVRMDGGAGPSPVRESSSPALRQELR